jgi:hypothetical protein
MEKIYGDYYLVKKFNKMNFWIHILLVWPPSDQGMLIRKKTIAPLNIGVPWWCSADIVIDNEILEKISSQ